MELASRITNQLGMLTSGGKHGAPWIWSCTEKHDRHRKLNSFVLLCPINTADIARYTQI